MKKITNLIFKDFLQSVNSIDKIEIKINNKSLPPLQLESLYRYKEDTLVFINDILSIYENKNEKNFKHAITILYKYSYIKNENDIISFVNLKNYNDFINKLDPYYNEKRLNYRR